MVRLAKSVFTGLRTRRAFDKVLDHMATEYVLHEELATASRGRRGERPLTSALSWEAPSTTRFLSPVNTLLGQRTIPPIVPIFVNAFIAPQPTARRCFQFGQHIARVVAKSPWAVGMIATGGLSHFPELLLGRVGETDTVFDRKLIQWMELGEHEPLLDLTADELHKTGSHEFLTGWCSSAAITPARATSGTSASCRGSTSPPWNGGCDESLRDQQSPVPPQEGSEPARPLHRAPARGHCRRPTSLTKNAPPSSRGTCGRSTSSAGTSTW